ncbi:MAG TPA: thioredoxin family protein [Burkholderiaceae bacterium]|jgi:thiol-disulfide isomerase/thioredoxin
MPSLSLENDNREQIAELLNNDRWVVACLCAAWCDACRNYRTSFDAWAADHPDKYFIWIDIEDQADVVGDIDVENFPTLLIQRGDIVAFFGTVLPDVKVANRLLTAQVEKNDSELQTQAISNPERKNWQLNCNLRQRLNDLL